MTFAQRLQEAKEAAEEIVKMNPHSFWWREGDQVRCDLQPSTTDAGIADCTISICDGADFMHAELDHIATMNPSFTLELIEKFEKIQSFVKAIEHSELPEVTKMLARDVLSTIEELE